MDIHLRIIGIALIILGSLHIIFPWYFNWKTELERLSLVNRQIMQIHTFFIALVVLLMGALCLVAPQAPRYTSHDLFKSAKTLSDVF